MTVQEAKERCAEMSGSQQGFAARTHSLEMLAARLATKEDLQRLLLHWRRCRPSHAQVTSQVGPHA